jgi:ATP-dependent exoDNAse (exonuclease V) beta subunit
MMPQEILDCWEDKGKEASRLGTILHQNIERFYLGEDVKDKSKEFSHFLEFQKKNESLKPYRTEWMVYDEDLELAGSIDMTFIDNGKLMLFDWKRSKEIKDASRENGYYPISHLCNANYWHYSLQLNIYKAILEKNYGFEVKDMALVVLHPNNDSYQQIDVPNLQEEVQMMFEERKKSLNKVLC